MEDLLSLRNAMKKKKPTFLRQDAHKKKKLAKKWRKPKGLQSKMRLEKKGYRKKVKEGYKAPQAVRGLSRDGFQLVTVATLKELAQVNKDKEKIVIPATVGLKKRMQLIKEALAQGIKIANYADPQGYLKQGEQQLQERKKKAKKEKKEEKEIKATDKESAAEKKEKKKPAKIKAEATASDDHASPDEMKKQEKKEKDKILTKRV